MGGSEGDGITEGVESADTIGDDHTEGQQVCWPVAEEAAVDALQAGHTFVEKGCQQEMVAERGRKKPM